MPAFSISPKQKLDPIYIDLSDGKTPTRQGWIRAASIAQPGPRGLEPINL